MRKVWFKDALAAIYDRRLNFTFYKAEGTKQRVRAVYDQLIYRRVGKLLGLFLNDGILERV